MAYFLDAGSADGAVSEALRPAAGVRRYFRDQNLSLGLEGTEVPAWLLNMLVNEVVYAVQAAGLAPDKNADNQLAAAMLAVAKANNGWETGDCKLTIRPVASPGWVRLNDGTLGDALSGATTRAHPDCEALFTWYWNALPEANAPVYTSAGTLVPRGASPAADWAAHRRIPALVSVGHALAVAGSSAIGLPAQEIGNHEGSRTHTLSVPELPPHDHDQRRDDGTGAGNGTGAPDANPGSQLWGKTGMTGEGVPFSIVQPTVYLAVHQKL